MPHRSPFLMAPMALICLVLSGCTSTGAYFSHKDDLDAIIGEEIRLAQEYVHVAIFTYTTSDDNPEIDGALRDVERTGLEVRIVADAGQTYGLSTQNEALVALDELGGLEVRTSNGYSSLMDNNIMHNKVTVVDGQTVITGSFNFTATATRASFENIVVIHDPSVAGQYEEAFQDIWNDPETMPLDSGS